MDTETTNLVLVFSITTFHAYLMYCIYFWFAECHCL
jgi:hypothetical protein